MSGSTMLWEPFAARPGLRLLVAALAVAALARTAAADQRVGVEWEYMFYDVAAEQELATLTGGDKRLLCTTATTRAFDKELPLLTVTYDRILAKGKPGTRARIELATSPLSLCDGGEWAAVQDSVRAFLEVMDGGTLRDVVGKLAKADPDVGWVLCGGGAIAPDAIRFEFANSGVAYPWDTQVNLPVALADLTRKPFTSMIDTSYFGSAGRDAIALIERLLPALHGAKLHDVDEGFLYVYFLSRAFLEGTAVAEKRHSTIKNRFGLLPKVEIPKLVPFIQQAEVKSFIEERGDEVLGGLKGMDDPELESFTSDRFGMSTVSNPIDPYVDADGQVFLVMEARTPRTELVRLVSPTTGASEFTLRMDSIEALRKELNGLAAPRYPGEKQKKKTKNKKEKDSCEIQ